MNISFDRIDRFIGIIEEVKAILQAEENILAISIMNNSPEMKERFININNSDESKEGKRIKQIELIIDSWKLTDKSAERHGYNNIQEFAESRLKQLFNEELFLKETLNACYKVAVCALPCSLMTEEGRNRFIKEVEFAFGTEINESDISNITQIDIPQIRDIEAEFWRNYPTVLDADKICNIYYRRLSGYIDTNSIDWFYREADRGSHPNLEELVLCGLLDEDSLRIIKMNFTILSSLAAGLCRKIIDFLNRYSTTQSQQYIQPQQRLQSLQTQYRFDRSIIYKIYNKCNGVQWESITIDQFTNLLNSGGEYQSLTIKKNETNRTKCVFRKVSSCIGDTEDRKTWIEDIKTNIFNGTDFMKATLRTDTSCSGYSSIDDVFKGFVDSL